MRKFSSVIVVLSMLLLMNGCGGNTDSLRFKKGNASIPHMEMFSYELNMGNKVNSGTLTAELWQNGECSKSSPVILNSQTKEIGVSLLIDGYETDEAVKGLNVQIDTDEVSGSGLTRFEIPRDFKGYLFSAYEDNESMEISEENDLILAAMAFDTGDGVRSIDCRKLVSEPSALSCYSYILVIRAEFSSEQIEAQAESKTDISEQ